ncbi:MAG: hypothetical protein ACREOV_05555 [Candidatus Dormibacteraceae bacterium]
MTDPEPPNQPPAPAPARSPQLTTAPTTPAVADALRAMGPDYEEALVASIAARVDELAKQREAAQGLVPKAPQPQPPQPPAPAPYQPPGGHHRTGHENPGLPASILSLIFGFVVTVVALTAGLAIAGPIALVAILIVWIALIVINFAIWR